MLTEMDRAPLLERSLQIRGIVRPTEHLPRGNRTIPCCPGLARVMGSPFLRFPRRRIGERLPTPKEQIVFLSFLSGQGQLHA